MTIDSHVISALDYVHRKELAQREAVIIAQREFMEAHGLKPPTIDGAVALARFRVAFIAAGLNDPDQHPELLSAPWRT